MIDCLERFVISGETELNFSFWPTVLCNRKSADAKVLLIKKAWWLPKYPNPNVEEKIPNFILQNTEKLAKEKGHIRIYPQIQKLKYTPYIHMCSCVWK